jgi:uncharacterized protein
MRPPEVPALSTRIEGGYWADRRAVNRDRAILYQWERYEASGTIDNFRIVAGLKGGERRGFFYADSDLHKWADAASRILRSGPSTRLESLLEEYVGLMALAQEPDGYLFTYNQIHFPGTRWKNLMIEHELYCLGHFIEAGVSRFEGSGRGDLLELAERSARLVASEFQDAPSERASGHEEIEIALLRLYRITRTPAYLDAARALLERRGRVRLFGARLALQLASQASRSRIIASRSQAKAAGASALGFEVGGNMGKRKALKCAALKRTALRREPPFIALRAVPVFLSGAYQQQHAPLREQVEPKGHAVRWAYLMTAAAMLCAETGDEGLRETMEAAWAALVDAKMYVTGGIGSLPLIEGFGRPYELDNSFSYSETCAAIGSILWNRELSLGAAAAGHARDARYADLIEWQLYNAAAVGVSRAGVEYFYRNSLSSDGEIGRQGWFATACCPSNISRLWADVDRLAFAFACGPGSLRELRIDQYVSASARMDEGTGVSMESAFPWAGDAAIKVEARAPLRLLFRVPGWATRCRATLNGVEALVSERAPAETFGAARFSRSTYERLDLPAGSSEVRLEFDMPVSFLRAHPKVRPDRGRVAICRGPLVYCAEGLDNPGVDLDSVRVDPAALETAGSVDFPEATAISGPARLDRKGSGAIPVTLRLLPYYLWGNRGPGAMRVFLREAKAD